MFKTFIMILIILLRLTTYNNTTLLKKENETLYKHSTSGAHRFNIFVHDELKAEIMALHQDDPVKQDMVEMISSPAYLMLQEQSGRRFIKTHLPFSLLPPNLLDTCKVF